MRGEIVTQPCARQGFHVCNVAVIKYVEAKLDDGTTVRVYPSGGIDVLAPDGWQSSWRVQSLSESHDEAHVKEEGSPLEGHLMCGECGRAKEERMTLGLQAGVKTCDDCTEEYAGPAYYTFLPEACVTSDRDGPPKPHAGCTGNLCPRCAGPYLEPDRAGDARRVSPAPPSAPQSHGATRPDHAWRSPNPTPLWASNDARGRLERAAAEQVHRDGVTQQDVGRLILARGFYAANDDMVTADSLTLEIDARKREDPR